MSRAYDSLMKSGKFTALQNTANNENAFDSIGHLVAICEKEGFIPRYYVEEPKDRVDETLNDLKQYTKSLIYDEMNLGSMIEEAMRTMALEEKELSATEEDEEDENLILDDEMEISDKDFEDYRNFAGEEVDLDNFSLEALIGEEDF